MFPRGLLVPRIIGNFDRHLGGTVGFTRAWWPKENLV